MMPRARRPAVVLTLDGLPIDEIVLAGPRMHHLSANVASKQSGNSHRNPLLRHLVNCRAFRALEYDYYPHDNADLARQNNRRDVIAFAGIECCISWLLRPVRWRFICPFICASSAAVCLSPPTRNAAGQKITIAAAVAIWSLERWLSCAPAKVAARADTDWASSASC